MGLIYLLKNVLLEIYAPKPEQPAQAAYASAYVASTMSDSYVASVNDEIENCDD